MNDRASGQMGVSVDIAGALGNTPTFAEYVGNN
jgi:hypothetical protein